jgi:hypothetical protein
MGCMKTSTLKPSYIASIMNRFSPNAEVSTAHSKKRILVPIIGLIFSMSRLLGASEGLFILGLMLSLYGYLRNNVGSRAYNLSLVAVFLSIFIGVTTPLL